MIRHFRSLDARILLCGVTAFALLVPLRTVTIAMPPVAFAATLVLFMAPGLLVTRWSFGDSISGPAVVPVAFAVSTGIFGLLGVSFLISHQSIEAYLWAAGTVLAVFLAAAGWRVLRARKLAVQAGPEAEGEVRYGPSAGWLWAPFVLLGGGLAFVATRRVPNNYDDVWVYLSWVRDFAGAERLALREPYFGEKVAQLSRVKVNGWLLEQAALSRVSGVDPIELVLRYLTPTLVVVALLAVYALARTLLGTERAAVLSASVYALFHVVFIEPSVHNVGVELAARIAEDKHAARFLILPIALLSAFLFVESRRWRYLGLFAFLCWTTIAVHPSVLPVLGLCMLGFGLAHVAANLRNRKAWASMTLLALAIGSVILGPLLLLFTGGSPAAVLYSADINATPPEVLEYTVFITESWRHIYEFDDGSYMMHPWLLLNPVMLGAYVLGVPFLLWRVRRSLTAQLLLGGLVVTTLVVYAPPVATFVGERLIVPGLLWRLAWPIPLLGLLTVGWMAWEALGYTETRLKGLGIGRGATRALPLVLVAVLVAVAVPPVVAKAAALYREYEVARIFNYHPDPIFPWIGDNLEGPAVLLARDSANNVMPAYSNAIDVVSQRGEGMIRDREELERRAGSEIEIPQRYLDVHDFFFGPTLDKEAHEILHRYKADYLMVYANGPLDERLKSLPGFSTVGPAPREKYALYKVDLRELGAPARGSNRPRDLAPPNEP
ncbi:MAG: DUF6077 domain-containing protein [Rubrobacter sp.]